MLVAISLIASSTVFAQDNDCTKTKFMLNDFWDNTYLGVSGGINTLIAKGGQVKASPDVEVYFGKWFTPGFGTRLEYQGFKLKENYPADFRDHYVPTGAEVQGGMQSLQYGFAYFHADAMWNLINAFSDTKKHAVTLAPYWHVGFVHLYDMQKGFFSEYRDNEFAMGPGVYFAYRFTKRLDVTADVRDVLYSGRFHNFKHGGIAQTVSASIGIAYNFGKTDWDKGVTAACYDDAINALKDARRSLDTANAALLAAKSENDALNVKIGALNTQIDSLRSLKSAVVVENNVGLAPLVVYYELNKDKLSETEVKHLYDYVNYILAKDKNFVFNITGSADKGTGSQSYNQKLAERRANGVRDILKVQYGISDENIIVNGKVSDEFPDQPRLDRSVTISK